MLGFFRRSKWRWFPFSRHHRRPSLTTNASFTSTTATTTPTTTTFNLLDLVKRSFNISPATIRGFWRISILQPAHVLQLLLQLDADVDVRSNPSRKVLILWELFRWASDSQKSSFDSFRHLSTSYHLMAFMLLNARMLEEVEFLLFHAEERGLVWSSSFYGGIVRGYVAGRKLEKSMSLFRRARRNGIVFCNAPTLYHELLRLLAEFEEYSGYVEVYLDMVEQRIGSGIWFHEVAVRTLCREKKVFEAANIARTVRETCNFTVSNDLVGLVDMIADGYCNKQDFEALLSFLENWGSAPGIAVCNNIVSTMCTLSGSDSAWLILQNFERLGFKADSGTFGILISWSCKERKVRNAFVFMSELLSRNLIPDVHAYNALISGLFRDGMPDYAWEVFIDMIEFGVRPGSSTFRVLLAGYCRERKFDHVTLVLKEMMRFNQVSLAPLDNAVSKAFTLIGLDSLGVKIKRISHIGHQQAEFFDSVGNGLYLDTDTDEYDKILTKILDSAVLPDFNLAVVEECEKDNTEIAIELEKEATRYGQKPTPCTYSALLKNISTVKYTNENMLDVFTRMQEFFNELDHQTLNLLAQVLSKKGFIVKASLVVDVLLRRQLPIENKIFDSLIIGLYRRRDENKLQNYWEVARRYNWLPRPDDFKVYLKCLSKFRMVKEIVDLLQNMSQNYPLSISTIIADVVKELCLLGSTNTAHKLLKEEMKKYPSLDHKLYEYIIEGFCKENKPTEAVEVLDIMLLNERNISINVFQLIVGPLLRLGHMDKVLNLKQVLVQDHPHVSFSLYGILISELSNICEIDRAELEMQEMRIGGLFPDNGMLNIILNAQIRNSNISKTYQLLCLMLKMNVVPSIRSYRNLIHLSSKQNQLVDCFNLIKLSPKEGNSTTLPFYNVLIFTLFRAGNLPLVEVVLDEMHRKNLILDEVSYNFLVFGYNRCGNTAKSVEALHSMLLRDLIPSHRSFRIVISYLCIHTDMKRALELSEVMGHLGIKQGSIIQNTLIGSLLSDGQLEEAQCLLFKSEKYDRIHKSICYDMVIRKLCEHGRTSKAIDLLNLMLKKGNSPSETSYNLVIKRLLAQGELDQALDFHVEMQQMNLHPGLDTCSELVRGLCGNGRTNDARNLLEETLHSGLLLPSSIIYLVVDRFSKENNLAQASNLLHKMQQYGYRLDFEIQWSFVSNLSDATSNKDRERNEGFLSHLLCDSGFSSKNSKVKGSMMPRRFYGQ